MNRSTTETIIAALKILSRDIQSEDGVANAVIAEAAERLEELNIKESETGVRLTQDWDGHWYLIPADKLEKFDEWVEKTNDYEADVSNLEDFNEYCFGGSPDIIIYKWKKE